MDLKLKLNIGMFIIGVCFLQAGLPFLALAVRKYHKTALISFEIFVFALMGSMFYYFQYIK